MKNSKMKIRLNYDDRPDEAATRVLSALGVKYQWLDGGDGFEEFEVDDSKEEMKKQSCMILQEALMNVMGDEWVPEMDDMFMDWLDMKELKEVWLGLYGIK